MKRGAEMGGNPLQIQYLYHSGFLVKEGSRAYVFDYYPEGEKSGLDILMPEQFLGLELTVFVSHSHYDHFTRELFSWKGRVPYIRYAVSSDVPVTGGESVLKIGPGEKRAFSGMEITALKSTDEGVAFLVDTGTSILYHAGDLNWWRWNGESEEYNRKMGQDYKSQVDLLKEVEIDAAFLPLDPRLEENYLLGIDYFCRTVKAKTVFPMHFGSDYRVFRWLAEDCRAAEYRALIQTIHRRGEWFSV